MNLIANTGIQFFTFPIEINAQDNFKMYFHEWLDSKDRQLKLKIAHYFSEDDVWVRKKDLSILGYVDKATGDVNENWEDIIKADFINEGCKAISIDHEEAVDSGCFKKSMNQLNWEKFENSWLPLPFFLKSGFGPTNWCRCKLIPTESHGDIKKYSLLVAFDTRSTFENSDYEDEDLNETPVFKNDYDRSKEYSL